jgi:hypothetical protein
VGLAGRCLCQQVAGPGRSTFAQFISVGRGTDGGLRLPAVGWLARDHSAAVLDDSGHLGSRDADRLIRQQPRRVVAVDQLAALGQMRQRGRDGRPARADELGEQAVRERHRATGRAVAAFQSSTHLEHELTVLLFMFAPVAQSRSAG